MLLDLLLNPLSNSHFLHPPRIRNNIGVVANAVDDWLRTKFLQFFTWELPTFIAPQDLMTYGTVYKSMVRAIFAPLANIIG